MQISKALAKSMGSGSHHIERTAKLSMLDMGLANQGIAWLSAPFGYGKTDLLRSYDRAVAACELPCTHVRIDFSSPDNAAWMRHTPRRLLARMNMEVDDHKRLYARGIKRLGDLARYPFAVVPLVDQQDEQWSNKPGVAVDELVGIMWLYLVKKSTRWARHFAGGGKPTLRAEDVPLVTIDDFPKLGARDREHVAAAMGAWAQAGARFVVTSGPMASIASSLRVPVYEMDARDMQLSDEEYDIWAKELKLSGNFPVMGLSKGIPLLVDTARRVVDAESFIRDDAYVRRAGAIWRSCRLDAMASEFGLLVDACALLGEGKVGQLAELGCPVDEEVLRTCAHQYPLLGIEEAREDFHGLSLAGAMGDRLLAEIAQSNPRLASRVVKWLLDASRYNRATTVARRMDDKSLLRIVAQDPAGFLAMGSRSLTERMVRVARKEPGVQGASTVRNDVANIRAIIEARGAIGRNAMKGRIFEDEGIRELATAIVDTASFWSSYAGEQMAGAAIGQDYQSLLAKGGKGDAELTYVARIDQPYATDGTPVRWLADADFEETGESSRICWQMGMSAMAGDGPLYSRALMELEVGLLAGRDRLCRAVYLVHAAACSIMCRKEEVFLSWMETLPDTAANDRSQVDEGFSGAIEDMVYQAMSLIVRSASGTVPDTIMLESAKMAYHRCMKSDIKVIQVASSALFAASLISAGQFVAAKDPAAICQTYWASHACKPGQMLGALAIAIVEGTLGDAVQAAASARIAHGFARRLRCRTVVFLARLVGTCLAIRLDDRHVLESRRLEAALGGNPTERPLSIISDIEVAVLDLALGSDEEAQAILGDMDESTERLAPHVLGTAMVMATPVQSAMLSALPVSRRQGMRMWCRVVGVLPQDTGVPKVAPGGILAPGGRGMFRMRVSVLGHLGVVVNGFPVAPKNWGRRDSRLLLEMLALEPDKRWHRSEIISTLWPESDLRRGRHSLNTAASWLRGLIGQSCGGPDYLMTAGDCLFLNPELVEVDLATFHELAESLRASGTAIPAPRRVEQAYRVRRAYGTGIEVGDSVIHAIQHRSAKVACYELVSCMLIGADAALSLGDVNTARYFVDEALVREGNEQRVRALARRLAAACGVDVGQVIYGGGASGHGYVEPDPEPYPEPDPEPYPDVPMTDEMAVS